MQSLDTDTLFSDPFQFGPPALFSNNGRHSIIALKITVSGPVLVRDGVGVFGFAFGHIWLSGYSLPASCAGSFPGGPPHFLGLVNVPY